MILGKPMVFSQEIPRCVTVSLLFRVPSSYSTQPHLTMHSDVTAIVGTAEEAGTLGFFLQVDWPHCRLFRGYCTDDSKNTYNMSAML